MRGMINISTKPRALASAGFSSPLRRHCAAMKTTLFGIAFLQVAETQEPLGFVLAFLLFLRRFLASTQRNLRVGTVNR